ncbi:hypothetical protein MKW92_041123 [Papaver armeniacum]|nr:hypothetical protein MKW92_041123 [Papaver armeniacum]
MAKHLLEASVMGFSLFLAWMTDCLHHYIRELRLLRKSMEAVKKQSRGFDDTKNGASEEAKAMEEELTSLKANVKKLESECETKKEDVKATEANAKALRKQSEGFLLEYDKVVGRQSKPQGAITITGSWFVTFDF